MSLPCSRASVGACVSCQGNLVGYRYVTQTARYKQSKIRFPVPGLSLVSVCLFRVLVMLLLIIAQYKWQPFMLLGQLIVNDHLVSGYKIHSQPFVCRLYAGCGLKDPSIC
jgi:hypothetical protein